VLKLVRALPKLQVLVGALLKSIPSMAYVTLLLILLFYVYAVAATFLFAANDPIHFRTLPISMLSLFRAVTLEDWTDIMYINMYGCDKYAYPEGFCVAPEAYPLASPFLFVSLVLLGTMIVLNLFIGVIMNGMAAAQEDRERYEQAQRYLETGETAPTLAEDLSALSREIEKLQTKLNAAMHRAKEEENG
jgi:voltage-gated sodium channel